MYILFLKSFPSIISQKGFKSFHDLTLTTSLWFFIVVFLQILGVSQTEHQALAQALATVSS